MPRARMPFHVPRGHRRGVRLTSLLVLLFAATPSKAPATIFFNWASAVSGSADDASKWNPNGVPHFDDRLSFLLAGTYTVTFPAACPTTKSIYCGNGNVTWQMTSPHTTGEVNVMMPNMSNTLLMNIGTLNVDHLNLGLSGTFSLMTIENDGLPLASGAVIHSKGINNVTGSLGDHIGEDGISELHIYGGGHYYSDQVGSSWPMELGSRTSAATTLDIAGFASTPGRVYSGVTVGTNGMTVGAQGVANVFASNGGYIDCAGTVMLASFPTGSGYITTGPTTLGSTSYLQVGGDLLIGNNGIGDQSGHAELTVNDHSYVTVAGHLVIGDPDNPTDKLSVMHVNHGGTVTVQNGLRVWPTSGVGLDLQGGITTITGGELRWPANKFLAISSTNGAPELHMRNLTTSIAPNTVAGNAQLFVGRNGTGSFFATGNGTIFAMGPGATTLGESAGGIGTITAESLAVFSSGGQIAVGSSGNGILNVTSGAVVDMNWGAVAAGATGAGAVTVTGSGSTLRLRDNFWIAGSFGGAGGTGQVTADQNSLIEVLHVTGVNPALVTVYPGRGTLNLRSGARLHVEGTLDTRGITNLEGGTIDGQSVNIPGTGTLSGFGPMNLTFGVNSGGLLDPHSTGDVGTMAVTGWYIQQANGHYRVDLQTLPFGSDLMTFTGTVSLQGTLDLRTVPGFAGHAGDTFTILTGSSVTGTFSSVTWNGGPLSGHASIVYGATNVRVVLSSATGVDPIAASAGATELRFASAGRRSTLEFALDLPTAANVEAHLYDVRGRDIGTLYDGSLAAGSHTLAPRSREVLPSGAYFAKAVIRMGSQTETRTARCILVH